MGNLCIFHYYCEIKLVLKNSLNFINKTKTGYHSQAILKFQQIDPIRF